MSSAEEICSLAMAYLGQNPVADLTDTTNANAVKCSSVFNIQRDALLREWDWGFARVRVQLQQDPSPPAYGYQYRYQLPADCCALRAVNDLPYDQPVSGLPQQGYPQFQAMDNYAYATPVAAYEKEGQYVLTDSDVCYISYTRFVNETGLFDSLFTDLLSIKIALVLAAPILKQRGLETVKVLNALYSERKPASKRVDAAESQPKQPNMDQKSSWLSARGDTAATYVR